MTPLTPKGLDDPTPWPLSPPVMADKVFRTIAAHLGLRHTELAADSHLRNDLHADLLDRIELAVTVEEQFGVRIPLEASMQAETVGDLIAVLERALDSKHPPVSAGSAKKRVKEKNP